MKLYHKTRSEVMQNGDIVMLGVTVTSVDSKQRTAQSSVVRKQQCAYRVLICLPLIGNCNKGEKIMVVQSSSSSV